MKIKALRNYLDTQLNRSISAGEVYEVEKARGEYIISNGFAEAYKEVKAEKVEEKVEKEVEVKPDGKKTSKKKK